MKSEGPEQTGGVSGADEPEERGFSPLAWSEFSSALLALALTAFAVLAVVVGPTHSTPLEMILARLLFGAAGLWGGSISVRWLLRMRDKQPRLCLTKEGILDRTGLGPPVFVPWAEIVSLQAPSGRALEIELRDPSSLKLSTHRRLLSRLLRRARNADLVIPVMGLDAPSVAIIGLAHSWSDAQLLRDAQTAKTIAPPQYPDSGS